MGFAFSSLTRLFSRDFGLSPFFSFLHLGNLFGFFGSRGWELSLMAIVLENPATRSWFILLFVFSFLCFSQASAFAATYHCLLRLSFLFQGVFLSLLVGSVCGTMFPIDGEVGIVYCLFCCFWQFFWYLGLVDLGNGCSFESAIITPFVGLFFLSQALVLQAAV